VRLTRAVAKGAPITWNDVDAPDSEAVRIRREMERLYAANTPSAKSAEAPALLRS
jgi:hypothetical protein